MTNSVPHSPVPKNSFHRRAFKHASLRLTSFFLAWIALFFFVPTIGAEERPDDSGQPSIPASTSEEGIPKKDPAGPFLSVEEESERRQFSLRPFYIKSESADGSEEKVQFLWPIYIHRRSEQDFTVRVFPIFTYWRDIYAYTDGMEYDVRYMLFPIVYGGDSTEDGKYFALFPIGGKIKHFLGRDEIRFVLFPLYMEYFKNELHQRNYLWPVLSFSEGGDYNGFRLWPLFGHFEKAGDYRKEFILWPFYHRQRFDLDKEQSGERMLLFPLYAREDSRRRRYRSVLWPFFSREENHALEFEKRSMPWPFVVIARGGIHQTQLWPVYGYRKAEDVENTFLFWPFWRQSVFPLDGDMERRETYLMPVLSSRADVSESRGTVRQRTRVWPLWRFRRFEDGSTYLRMLSLLWFDDERGAEQMYSPLWTIYERRVGADGASQTDAFWGLYRGAKSPTGSEARIPLIFSHSEDAERDSEETEIMGGLVGTSRTADSRRLQLLYFLSIPY